MISTIGSVSQSDNQSVTHDSATDAPSDASCGTTYAAFLSDTLTPVSAYNALRANGINSFLFESAEMNKGVGRFSILGADPAMVITLKGTTAHIARSNGGEDVIEGRSPLAVLEEIMRRETAHFRRDVIPDVLPFAGGLIGYLGYGAVQSFDSIPMQGEDVLGVPDGVFCLYDSCVVFDHLFRRCYVISHTGKERVEQISSLLRGAVPLPYMFDLSQEQIDVAFLVKETKTQYTKAEFVSRVEKCKNLIADGEVFQIVLSQRFSKQSSADPLEIYRVLQALSPSPYAFLLELDGFSYLGSSPETFVRVDNDCSATVKALAGTRRRGSSRAEDDALAVELLADEKERAEHLMLVDLARNDLGRVSKSGTVRVERLCDLVRYSHVMHLSSTIRGTLDASLTSFDAVKACFPAGTVSGAPKIRAMEHLSQIETEKRGIYSGMVGYFDFRGASDSAIAIRSALVKDGVVHAQAGAGIVFDSIPALEYKETLNKVRPVLAAVKVADSGTSTKA